MKKSNCISVAVLSLLFALGPVNAQILTPTSHDFGKVMAGDVVTIIVTLFNDGFDSILIDSAEMDGDDGFSVTSSLFLPDSQGYLESIDFTVTFKATSVGEFSSKLVIKNGEEFIVPISCTVVPAHPSTVVDIIDFINVSVSNETLEGAGPGASADGRLNALINMLNQASNLISAGDYEAACDQLGAALKRCDDFVEGTAQNDLKQMITEVMSDLGC